jgi:hypothetical protein
MVMTGFKSPEIERLRTRRMTGIYGWWLSCQRVSQFGRRMFLGTLTHVRTGMAAADAPEVRPTVQGQ